MATQPAETRPALSAPPELLATGLAADDEDDGVTLPPSERRCIVTRKVAPKAGLIRFVVDPEGVVQPDPAARLPGRGMWLSADRDVLNKAVASNGFARAARRSVKADADLADRVEQLLSRRLFDGFGLARRAGLVTLGFDQVRDQLQSGRVALLVTAADGAEDGRRKLRALAPDLPLIVAGSRDELGAAVGREQVVHIAVAPGGLVPRLLREAQRLAGFRPDVSVLPDAAEPMVEDEPKGTTGSP